MIDGAALVSRVHSHTSSSERHADGPAMTEEDDCVIAQAQERVVFLVKFNSQTSQFQMFETSGTKKESGHHSLLLTAGYLFIIYHLFPSSTLQNSRDIECRWYWTCTCYVRALTFLVQKQGLCVIIGYFKNIIAKKVYWWSFILIITSLEVESKQRNKRLEANSLNLFYWWVEYTLQ